MIYFISDTHYHHTNICSGTSGWSDKNRCRKFESLSEHDDWIVNSINNTVGINDELYHLGDWSFGGEDQIELFRNRLICKNIHLICGNHDHHISNHPERYSHLFKTIIPHPGIHHISVNGQKIIMSHYAARTWYADNKGSWMLYGHSHGTLTEDGYHEHKRRTIDVGIDNLVKQGINRPISITELRQRFSKINAIEIDHHNPKTNVR